MCIREDFLKINLDDKLLVNHKNSLLGLLFVLLLLYSSSDDMLSVVLNWQVVEVRPM